MRIILVAAAALLLAGCVRTAASIVTFPVKAVGQGVDWATTSQDEADRAYGRKMRKQEAREGRELKKQREREAKEARKRERERDD